MIIVKFDLFLLC